MALDSPSSPQQTPPSSDAEDYPVWKRWGDIDEHNKTRESGESESSSDQKVAWERLKAELRAKGGSAAGPEKPSPSARQENSNGRPERPAAKADPFAKREGSANPSVDADALRNADSSGDADSFHNSESSIESGSFHATDPSSDADRLENEAPARDFRSWEADFSALDIRDRVVIMLLFKQVVQIEEVEAAWRRFQKTNQGRSREPLWRILARDPAFDRNRILAEAAKSAGYEAAHIDPLSAAAFIDAQFNAFSEADWERMLTLNVVPIAKEEDSRSGRSRWVFVSPDPTRPGVSNLLRDLKLGGHVLRFAPERVIDSLLADLTGRGGFDHAAPVSLEPEQPAETQTENSSEAPQKAAKAPGLAESPVEAGSDPPATADSDVTTPPPHESDADATGVASAEAREMLDGCLVAAVDRQASGVHLLPVENGLQVDMRIDGELERWQTLSREEGDELLAVVKEEALNIRPTESDSVQDGLITRTIGGASVRFRVSVLPIAGSFAEDRRESIVIGIVGEEAPSAATLDALGLPDETLSQLRSAIAEPRGMVVLAGPSGSGRAATLSAILNEIVTPKVNVITLEESVTHEAQGVRQVRLNHKLDHEDALEAVRRHDPDVILVGELRTKETAELALKLANAGHLVFSRMPAHDSTGVVGRLLRLGVDPFLIAYAINLVVAQRLVQRLCPDCKQPAKHIDGELLRRLGFSRQEIASTKLFDEGAEDDCATCSGRRYGGTQIIAESMPFTHDTRRLIALADKSLDDEDVRAQAVREGMTTIRSSARNVVLSGETSVSEMIRVTAGAS